MLKNILLLGIPRSGTTWLANIFISSGKLSYIHEPDNERHTYTAYYYKRGLERFPFIRRDAINNNYFSLFNSAFHKSHVKSGSYSNELLFRLAWLTKEKIEYNLSTKLINRVHKAYPEMYLYPFLPKQPQKKNYRKLVKSVHAILSADFLINNFDVQTVIIIRHPAAVVSSHLYLKNPDIDRKIYLNKPFMEHLFGKTKPDYSVLSTKESFGGFQTALFYKQISNLVNKYKNIELLKYEDLATNPGLICKNLFEKLEIEWNEDVERYLRESNKEGEGYETNRISKQQVDIWKERLNEKQVMEIQKGYSLIKTEYYKDFQTVNS